MTTFRHQLLRLIIARVGLVATVMLLLLPPQSGQGDYFRIFFLTVLALSAFYLLLWKYADLQKFLYGLQFYADLVLITCLIAISGGITSFFVPFYVLIIVYASLLSQREGGVLALILSLISYAGIAHLSYLDWLPKFGVSVPLTQLLFQASLNISAFVAVAALGIYLSERLYKARQELGATLVLHEVVIASLHSGLMTLDLKGRVTSMNRAAERICGYTQEQALGKPIQFLFRDEVSQQILQANPHGETLPIRVEHWFDNRANESIFLGLSCSPLVSPEKEEKGYVLSFQDLTEIKKREEEVQFKEQMAALGQMAAGLAHEIRNPLGAVSGSIQLLQSDFEASPESRRLIQISLRECERLNKTVADFLAFAGPRPVTPQVLDLTSLVEEAAELLKNDTDFQDHHSIVLSSQPDPVYGLADSNQIRQVVWNILQNGIRAMPEGGQLKVVLSAENFRVRLSFQDQGVGMSEEQKRGLFQPFQSGFRKGIGLGMAIVYQVVRNHDGWIEVKSRPRVGTTIDVSLPSGSNASPRPASSSLG